MEFNLIFVFRILVASSLGFAVGLERELRDKPAGIKTMMLIAVATCAMTFISIFIAFQEGHLISDPGRIAAQIIPGIGFIGAGVIVKSKHNIHGLTSAATIWVVASIGMICGLGYLLEATIVTATLLLTLTLLVYVNKAISKKKVEVVIRTYPNSIDEQLKATVYFANSKFSLYEVDNLDNRVSYHMWASNRNIHFLEEILKRCPVGVESHSLYWH